MLDWLPWRKNKKYRKIFFSLVILGVLLIIFTIIFFFSNLYRNTKGDFFSEVRQVHKILGKEEDLCLGFGNDSYGLVDGMVPSRHWILIGDEFAESEKTFSLQVLLDPRSKKYFDEEDKIKIYYELVNTENEALTGNTLGAYFSTSSIDLGENLNFEEQIYVGSLTPGKYKIKIRVEFSCGTAESFYENLVISYPLYVVWTFDWEGYDVKSKYLEDIDELCERHDNFPLTHLINPRLFITNTISKNRRDIIRDWLISRRDKRGDSLGLHLHGFYENFAAAGVELPEKTNEGILQDYPELFPSASTTTSTIIEIDRKKLKKKQIYDLPYWGYAYDDGYDIPMTHFSYNDFSKVLQWSIALFEDLGLGRPITYRGGGWFVNLTSLRALEDNGFVVDTSGRTKYNFGTEQMPGFWDLSILSEPYRPSRNNQNSSLPPNFNLWEFPNNGGDSWWYTAEAMKERFNLNWGAIGEPLLKRKVVVFLSHPDWFHVDKPKMDELFNYTDLFLNSRDGGPVVYANLEEVYEVFSK